MDNKILNNKEWKESNYGNPFNTATHSFFKAHDEHDIEEGNELRQMKRKEDNQNDEQPNKRELAAKKSTKLVKYRSSGILRRTQEEEDDIEDDIEEYENEPELAYPYEEVDHLIPLPPASKSEPEDVNEDSDGLLSGLMRRDINSLFGRMASLSRRLCGRETAHALVEKKGKATDEYYGKLILDLGNEVRSSGGARKDCNGKNCLKSSIMLKRQKLRVKIEEGT
ncbi:hypothetical protein Tco_1246326 [Tanacetum coccineum]